MSELTGAQVIEAKRALGYALLRLQEYISDYVFFTSSHHLVTVTLWTAATWLPLSAFDAFAYLAFESPEKGAGKTRAEEVMEGVVRNPWRASMATPAALFRKIDRDKPTLLLDEVDAVFNQKGDMAEAIRGVLNAGSRRGGTVPRVVGDDVVDFNAFCPKILSGIKSLPETLMDRSIAIKLTRRAKGDSHGMRAFRTQVAGPEALAVRTELTAAMDPLVRSSEFTPWVRSFDYVEIEGLTDRQVEGWQPLLVVAALAEPNWLRSAMAAARFIYAEQRASDDTAIGAMLLRHIREELGEEDKITQRALLRQLRERDDGPWAVTFDSAFDLDDLKAATRLTKLLKPYGITSRRPRFDGVQQRGYVRDDFTEAWRRWLSSE